MRPEPFDSEGRDSEDCRDATRQVLADPGVWALVLLLLVLAALLS